MSAELKTRNRQSKTRHRVDADDLFRLNALNSKLTPQFSLGGAPRDGLYHNHLYSASKCHIPPNPKGSSWHGSIESRDRSKPLRRRSDWTGTAPKFFN
jgi:hypothetical protein